MKAYSIYPRFCVASILFLTLFTLACSSTKYLNDDQKLVRRVTIEGIDKQFSEQANYYVSKDLTPTSGFNLALYNFFNAKDGKYKSPDKIKDIGQAPNLLDSTLVEVSRREIEKFLIEKSFFKAKVKSEVEVKGKKAYVKFVAAPGPSFSINSFSYKIADSAIQNLYETKRPSFTKITVGQRYDGDSIRNESRQIYNLLHKNGYFDYVEQYLHFNVDTHLNASRANIEMILSNPVNASAHKVYHLSTSHMLVKTSRDSLSGFPDTAVVDSQFFFKDFSHRFDANDIYRYQYLRKGERYDIDKKNLTYDRLFGLNVFRSVKIDYVKSADSMHLHPYLDATPMKRLSNRIEGEITFNSERTGFNVGNTYTNRNVFGGAEQLDFRARYGLLLNPSTQGGFAERVFNRDVQFGVNLTFPRLLVPFNTGRIIKNGLPRTTLSSSIQIFDQLNAFRSRLFINSLTYEWVESRDKLHSYTPLSIEYRKGKFSNETRQDLIDKGYNLYVNTNDRAYFNMASLYTYTLNASRLLNYEQFIYLRASADIGGNVLSLIDKLSKRDSTFLGLRYLQYVKTEFDVRKYFSLGGEGQFIARINPGIAVPFGNSKELPFEKNFFAGGSSGNRAWQARTLGPGNYNREVLGSYANRRNLTTLDQIGEIKIEGNLEYRYKILNNFFGSKLKGGTFTDFGNIWRLRETPFNPGGEFKFNRLFDQIAVGAGTGLRFDVEYFVFRIDVGFKIKDPQFKGSDQWVIKHLFDKDFKAEYKATHDPDSYRFVQYNVGIGMPF